MEEHTSNEYEIDPIEVDPNGEYWFWDEIWVNKYGPFKTLEKCKDRLYEYCKELDRRRY